MLLSPAASSSFRERVNFDNGYTMSADGSWGVPEARLWHQRTPDGKPMPPVENSPIEILKAWTALEAVSPQTFRKPEDLVSGDRRAVARLDNGRLPWSGAGDPARRPKTRLFYQILLGTVDMEAAVAALLSHP
jgi:hypothetical protein